MANNYRMGLFPKNCKQCANSKSIAEHNVRMCMVETKRDELGSYHTCYVVNPHAICDLFKEKK